MIHCEYVIWDPKTCKIVGKEPLTKLSKRFQIPLRKLEEKIKDRELIDGFYIKSELDSTPWGEFKREISFTIPGSPHGKGRPRFRSCGKFVQTYTDKKTKAFEQLVGEEFKKQVSKDDMEEVINSPIKMKIEFHMEIPKSAPKKVRTELVDIPHFKKPDIDNLIKCIMDGLNGVCYTDDSLIYEVRAVKKNSLTPCTKVTIIY